MKLRPLHRALLYSCAFFLVLAAGARTEAADISPVQLDERTTAIFLIGDIKPGDSSKFKSLAEKYDKAIVLLESNGGSVAAAIDIGEAIRLKGYSTAVINDSSCNSACALIWLAGSPRKLSKSGRIGFHAAYSEVGGEAKESGVANAMVGRYLTLLNLPEQAVLFATTSPPTSLNWLTSSNYRSTGIETTVIDDIHLDQEAAQSQTKYTRRNESDLWKTVSNWSVYVDHTLDESCFLASRFTNNTVFRIGFNMQAPGQYYLVIGNPDWQSLRDGQHYQVNFKFGSESPWDVSAKAIKMGDSVDLMATFTDDDFWREFVSAPFLSVTKEGKAVTAIRMTSAKEAFDALVECQRANNKARKGRDPFAQ